MLQLGRRGQVLLDSGYLARFNYLEPGATKAPASYLKPHHQKH